MRQETWPVMKFEMGHEAARPGRGGRQVLFKRQTNWLRINDVYTVNVNEMVSIVGNY